jgi:exosortase
MVAILMIYGPLRELLRNVDHSEYYSHILLIPLVSAYFVYVKRKTLFSSLGYSYVPGMVLLLIGILSYFVARDQRAQLNLNDTSSLMVFSAIVFWIGGILLLFGTKTFRKIFFPLLFLVFMIPIPSLLMNKIISLLQTASAGATHLLFTLTGIPFSREGFTFHLLGMNVEVAEACSGIRSSLALFIVSIIAGYLFLRPNWKKVVLSLAVFPITIFKNAVRIITLSLLGAYVNPRIFEGELHKKGGILFFVFALGLLSLILWLLRRSDMDKVEAV